MNKLSVWLCSPVLRRVAVVTLFLVGWTWVVVRFLGLEVSPPGFFMDEATPAVHAMCLAQTGKNLDGQSWPLYSHAAGGGHHPLTLLAFDIAWMKAFGTSRAAFRAVAAFWILLTSLGLFLLAWDLSAMIPTRSDDERAGAAKRSLPWLVLLAALLSPWSFQFSRVAWEAPLAPAFMIFALVGMLRGYRGDKWAIAWLSLAGFCAAASMTTYPPMRAVVPLIVATVGASLILLASNWVSRWKFIRGLFVSFAVWAICIAPTVQLLAQGKINGRMNNIAIWRADWVESHAGWTPRWIFLLESFLDNFLVYLRPSFLFFTGDASMRHSPRISGHLSPVDILALVFVAGMVAVMGARLLRGRPVLPDTQGSAISPATRWFVAIALCSLLGGFYGLVPAALTFDGLPHALRAIGAWPFVALFTGAVLSLAWGYRGWVAPVLALVALVHTVHFLPAYFGAYDKAEKHWFMRDMTDVLEKERNEKTPKPVLQIVSEHMAYSYAYNEVPLYYLMTDAGMSCEEALKVVLAIREKERGK